MDKWHLGNTFFRHLVGSCVAVGSVVVKTQSMDWFIIIFLKNKCHLGVRTQFSVTPKWIKPSYPIFLIRDIHLVGGCKHFLYSINFHDIWYNPSHWRTHIFQEG